jgi:malate permease and related proteins
VGVLATVAAIGISASIGVWAELRWQDRAAAWARSGLVVSLYTLVPFVTFFNVARVELDADLGGGIALGWVAILLASGIAWLIGARVLGLPRASTGALICCTLVPNSGFLGYPLCASLLGFDSLGEAVVYDITVAVPSLLLVAFAVGAAFGEEAGEGPRERAIAFFTRNPPLYAAIAALLAPESLAPDALVDASRIAVIALLPIGFFAVGTMLAEEEHDGVRLGLPLGAPGVAAILLRLLVAPGLLLLIALPLIDLPDPYLLLAAMPCGINVLLVAHVYGLDGRLAAQAVAWSTVIVVGPALLLFELAQSL